MNSENRLCGDCRLKDAEFFCSCTEPEATLCASCLPSHTRKLSRKGHQSWSLCFLHLYKNPHYVERANAFTSVHAAVLSSLEEVDRAIAEFSAKVREVQAQLTTLCTEKVRQLQKLRAELARDLPIALEEVQETLGEEQPRLNSLYACLIRNCIEQATSLQLFTYSVTSGSMQAFLDLGFHIATLEDIRPARFAGVHANEAFLYDVKSQQVTRRTLPLNFGLGGSYVELDRNRLLCLGADSPSSAVYSLDLLSFQLSALPGLLAPVRYPGVAKMRSHIYLFGGNDGQVALRTCAKMSLADQIWTGIRSMVHPRAGFTPCLFRSLLYLVSAAKAAEKTIETFNSESEIFTVLSISLPPLLKTGMASVAFIANGELCLLTDAQQMARWIIDTKQEFRLSNTVRCWSGQQPLVVGKQVLIAHCGEVRRIDLETYSFL